MISNCRAYQHVNVYKGEKQPVMKKKISVWCFISSFRFVCIILFFSAPNCCFFTGAATSSSRWTKNNFVSKAEFYNMLYTRFKARKIYKDGLLNQ